MASSQNIVVRSQNIVERDNLMPAKKTGNIYTFIGNDCPGRGARIMKSKCSTYGVRMF